MLDLFPVELREPVWYVLAGFILGFVVSTLWEWLYFRRYRGEIESNFATYASTTYTSTEESEAARTVAAPILQEAPDFEPAGRPSSYRSPPLFLNRERSQATSKDESSKTREFIPAEYPVDYPVQDVGTESLPDALQESSGEQPDRAKTVAEIIVLGRPTVSESQPVTESQPAGTSALAKLQPTDPQPIAAESAVIISTASISTASISTEETPKQAETEHNELVQTSGVVQTGEAQTPKDANIPIQMLEDGSSTSEDAEKQDESPTKLGQNSSGRQAPRSRGYPDDLTEIRGVGEVYKRRLFAANIFTFHHVATSDIEVLWRATQATPNANVESWSTQAETLAQKYQRLNASYSGPMPNDLDEIPGIGAQFAKRLYRNGICTFQQLADTSIDELRLIFPSTILGREVDFQQLLDAARKKVEAGKS